MDELNAFYKKVQTYLMKKNQECGELQFLTLRATDESISHINDVCESMLNLFQTFDIPIKEKIMSNDEKCALSYTYLLLNTRFKNQERLGEDIVSGHLVDMCPPLSPYLFIQILWNLEYEKILIQSLLYMPLDLFTEVLDVVTKCIEELPYPRSLNSICCIISIAYTKFITLNEVGVQSWNVEESIENFLINFQEFVLLLTNPKVIPPSTSPNLKKNERYGVMLKKLVSTIRNCLERKPEEVFVSRDLKKFYNITFGKEPYRKCEETRLENAITALTDQLIDLLLTKVKEVNCNIYMNWVQIDDEENSMITLQRSIGIECYYFVECIKNNERLSQNTHLIECLQHLSSKPDPKESSFVLSLEEVCCAISNGKKELMKELLCRHKEWDRSMLDFVHKNKHLLQKEDCLNLLEHLTFVLEQSQEEDFNNYSYTVVMQILSSQSLPNIYDIVIIYLTRHDGKSHLESPHTEEAFDEFITRNSNLLTITNLKMVLLFLLQNLRLTLTTLLKITIGHPQYKNILISANDMLLLSPFMQISEENNQVLLTSILRTICLENAEWNQKKLMNFIKVLLVRSIIEVDDLMNNVFIPYLEEETFSAPNVIAVLYNIRKLQTKCTKETNLKSLTIALAKKMSFLRKNRGISKCVSSEILSSIIRILKYFLEVRSYKIPTCTKKEIFDEIQTVIEPIEKLHFSSLWHLMQKGVSVIDITEDYGRRCFIVIERLKEDRTTSERLRNSLSDLSLLREDFLRHLIIRSIGEEYQRLGADLTIMCWYLFGWNDELDAYNHFSRLTMEACCLSLEYPSIGEDDLFGFLFESFTRFSKKFVLLKGMKDPGKVYESLIKRYQQLEGSIRQSRYADLYDSCFINVNNDAGNDTTSLLEDTLNNFDHFSDRCLELNYDSNEKLAAAAAAAPRTRKISNFYVTHEVISACMKVPAAEAYECMKRMDELFV
nr:uncharacterized protein LOC116431462 [Nomia melanderi]